MRRDQGVGSDAGHADWIRTQHGAIVHRSVVIYEGAAIARDVVIEEYCVVAKPHRDLRRPELLQDRPAGRRNDLSVTTISDGCYVQSHCVIYAGATLGERVICTDYCSVDTDAVIGHDSKLQYRASIHSRVIVGAGCRIGGFLCDDTRVGDRTSFYGETVHSYDHHGGDSDVSAPIIDSDVIVGFGAVLIGGIKIGQGAYIGAGAVVTQDVPVGAIVVGANRVSTRQDWPGKMSRRLPG